MENKNTENKQESTTTTDNDVRAKKLGPAIAGIGASLLGGFLGDKIARVEVNVHVGDKTTNYHHAPTPLVGGCA